MNNLEKLTNECYTAATEEVGKDLSDLFEGKLTYLQFVDQLGNSPLNVGLAVTMISNNKKVLTTLLSCWAVKEVQNNNSEVSTVEDIRDEKQ